MKKAQKIDILDLLADAFRCSFWWTIGLIALFIIVGGGVTI